MRFPLRLLMTFAVCLAGTLGAQDPPPAPAEAPLPPESLAARVARAEEAIELLRARLQEQDQAKVGSRLRNRVQLSGLILINAYSNGAAVNNSDVPLFADSSSTPGSHVGGTARQTRLGITVSDARALGGALGGDLQLDFYGGSVGGRINPLLRIRTATARIDWPHFGILLGQESPLVAPLNPVSFASSGLPGFANAGNLWLWIPQARATLEMGRSFRVGLQGAALAPLEPSPARARFFADTADNAESSGRPTVEGRMYFGWGDGDAESQFGFGIHRGWLVATGDTLITSEALTVDGRLAFGEKLLIQGEAFFSGQALGGLGGGGIGQNRGAGGVPVRTQGAWVQLNLRPTFAWELGGGYGFDDPDDSDLTATARFKNVAFTGHLHWRPGGGLLTGVEFRRIETTYATGVYAVHHLNGFVGLAF